MVVEVVAVEILEVVGAVAAAAGVVVVVEAGVLKVATDYY